MTDAAIAGPGRQAVHHREVEEGFLKQKREVGDSSESDLDPEHASSASSVQANSEDSTAGDQGPT